MGEHTDIAWTDHTFNPWWGCTRVSPGCTHCYAETFAKRTGHDVWGKHAERRTFGDKHWAEPLQWDAAAAAAGRPALVFCASMADVFEDHSHVGEERERLWDLIGRTPHLIWQLLTKRPEHVPGMVPDRWLGTVDVGTMEHPDARLPLWPHNVWIGTTVEDQPRADERIPHLLDLPAPVRFLSCEPLLGPVDLHRWLRCVPVALDGVHTWAWHPDLGRAEIGWVIVGGESGPGHRPLDLRHARRIVDQCEVAGVPVFFKQVGGRTNKAGGDQLDGRTIKQYPPEARRS